MSYVPPASATVPLSRLRRGTAGQSHLPGDEVGAADAKRWLKHVKEEQKILQTREDCLGYSLFMVFVLLAVFYFSNIPADWDLQNMFSEAFISPPFGSTQYPCQRFKQIQNVADFWAWLSNPFLANLGADCTGSVCKVHKYNIVQGSVMMRQQRVKPNTDCSDNDSTVNCYGLLTENSESESAFSITSSTGVVSTYIYHSDTGSHTLYGVLPLQNANIQEYRNGGYPVFFTLDATTTWSTVAATLQNAGGTGTWVDDATRVVIIAVNLYNPGYDKYMYGTIMVEFSPSGAIYPTYRVTSFTVKPSDNSDWSFRLFVWFVVVFGVYFYSIRQAREVVKYVQWQSRLSHLRLRLNGKDVHKMGFCDDAWTVFKGVMAEQAYWGWYEYLFLLSWYITLVTSALFIMSADSQDTQPDASMGNIVSLGDTAYASRSLSPDDTHEPACRVALYTYGVTAFLSLFKFARFLYYSKKLTLMCASIAGAFGDLMAFMVLFFSVFIAFAVAAHIVFGSEAENFCTFGKTMGVQVGMLFGHVKVQELQFLNKYMGPIYFYSFLMIMTLILMNMFIGVIANSLFDVRRKTRPKDRGGTLQELIKEEAAYVKSLGEGAIQKLGAGAMCGRFCVYMKDIFFYALTGVYTPDPPELGAILAFSAPVITQMITNCEAETKKSDAYSEVTLSRSDFRHLIEQVMGLSVVNANANSVAKKRSEVLISKLATEAWVSLTTWLDQMQPSEGITLYEMSEYQMLNETYRNIKSMHSRMKAEMSVLRASQCEVLRAAHSIENRVVLSDAKDSEADRYQGERHQAYVELYASLDDRTFIRQERHLDDSYLDMIKSEFHTTLQGTGDKRSGPEDDFDFEMAAESIEQSNAELTINVPSITLTSISTLPLFRDHIFCQVEIKQEISNPHTGRVIKKLVSRTDSATSTSHSSHTGSGDFTVLSERVHTFRMGRKPMKFRLTQIRQVEVNLIVYHEVPGIRTIEVCRATMQVDFNNRPPEIHSMDLIRSEHYSDPSHMLPRHKIGTITYETSWDESAQDEELADHPHSL